MNKKSRLKKLALAEGEIDIGFGSKVSVNEMGSSGTTISSGVISEEFLMDLQGQKAAVQYDRMRRRETQVAMILDAVKNPILGANWTVEVDDENDAKQAEMKALVEWNFKHGLLEGLKQHLKEALTLLDFGFSVFEAVHATENVPALGKLTTFYKKFGFRKQITITKWNLEKQTGRIISVEQSVASDIAKDDTVEIPGEFLLVFTNKKEGDNYEGLSLLRPMYGAYSRKDLYLKLTAIGVEKYAIGVVKGKTPAGKVSTQEDALFEGVLQAYSENQISYLKLPAGWDADIIKTEFDPAKMVPILNFENEEMARSVVASFLMLGQGGNGGAYSLGTDLSDFFLGGIQSYADIICEGHNRHSIPAICQMNYGPQPSYPRLKCTGINDKAGKELAEIILSLTNSRSLTPDAKLEDFLRSQYKLPQADPETARQVATTVGATTAAPGTAANDAGAAQGEGAEGQQDPAADGTTSAVAAQDVRKETLNGAQVTAIVEIVQAVAGGQLPRDSAVATLQIAFNLTPEDAEKMLGSAGNGFTPTAPVSSPDNNAGGNGAPAGDDEPPPEDTPPAGKKPKLSEAAVKLAEGYRTQFNNSKAATKALMQNGVRAMADDLKKKLAKNWNELSDARKAEAVNGVEVSTAVLNVYKASLRKQMAEVAEKAINQARKEVPAAAKKAEFADYDPWKNLNPLVKKAILSQIGLVADTQAADVSKVVLFQWSSSSASITDVDGILKDVEDRVQNVLAGQGGGMSLEAASGDVVAHVTQNSRNSFFFAPEVLETLESFTFVNEDPVSEICKNLNGQTFSVLDPAAEQFYPPLHHNCKSRLVPNEKGTGGITGIGIVAETVEERQRLEKQITLHDCLGC